MLSLRKPNVIFVYLEYKESPIKIVDQNDGFKANSFACLSFRMKKKECPSCAMQIDADSKQCPVCNYEFPPSNRGLKWVALALALLFLLYIILL